MKRVVFIGLGLAAGVLGLWLVQTYVLAPPPPPPGDDDQPPVVVSNGGSIKFEAQDNGQGHGQFVLTNDHEIWYDGKGNGNDPQKFTVQLYYVASTAPAVCKKLFGNVTTFSATINSGATFTVAVTGTSPNRHMTISTTSTGASDKFTVDPPPTEYIAHFAGADAYLKNAMIGSTTCEFDGNKGRFFIKQLH